MLYWSDVVKRELRIKAKLSVCRSAYSPTLTYGHMIVTERMRSWVKATEVSFFWRVAGLSFRKRVSRAAPLHQKDPVEVVWESDSFRTPSRHTLLDGDPGADPGLVEEIISLHWLGNASVFPRMNWRKSGVHHWDCCPEIWTRRNGREWMDGWMDGRTTAYQSFTFGAVLMPCYSEHWKTAQSCLDALHWHSVHWIHADAIFGALHASDDI